MGTKHMAIDYQPANFRDVYQRRGNLGRKVWAFLTTPENLIRLATASDLGRPAIEAVAAGLEDQFGERIEEDRVRQMIGHMVRQIMERGLGYILSHANVKVRTGSMFSRASKYRKL